MKNHTQNMEERLKELNDLKKEDKRAIKKNLGKRDL
jgi:hypothetical protein